MRILFCTNSIGTRGGIERVTIVKANALAELRNGDGFYVNKVGIAFSDRFLFPETIHPLSPLVKTFDTEADIWHDWNYQGLQRWTEPWRKMLKYWRELQCVVNEFQPDILIGVGQSEKFILPKLKADWPIVRIREVHFNSTYRRFSFGLQGLFGPMKRRIADFVDYNINCINYDKVYLLTKQDKEENFSHNRKFGWMWNPSSFLIDSAANRNCERQHIVIASGRLTSQKDYPAMLRSWAHLGQLRGDWKLRILGEGGEMKHLKQMTYSLGIADSVEFAGFTYDVVNEMRRASVFAMTSLYDGLALVIVEAMSSRLPVVSFDTRYGPRDIMRDGVDGFLVEDRDEMQFAKRLSQLISDTELREKMADNAEERAKEFDVNKIAARWMKEYQQLLDQKRGTA